MNIIVVSDHGMTTVTPDKVQHVELDNFLLVDQVENVADSGAFSNIKVKEGYVDQVCTNHFYQMCKSFTLGFGKSMYP